MKKVLRDVRPPSPRPVNESAGWLGFYCRRYLPTEFDLIDHDGCDPVQWLYYKSSRKILRFIEEKPMGQELHPSQERVLPILARVYGAAVTAGEIEEGRVYVIWEADRLGIPEFPISVTRIGSHGYADSTVTMDQWLFDDWLLLGDDPWAER